MRRGTAVRVPQRQVYVSQMYTARSKTLVYSLSLLQNKNYTAVDFEAYTDSDQAVSVATLRRRSNYETCEALLLHTRALAPQKPQIERFTPRTHTHPKTCQRTPSLRRLKIFCNTTDVDFKRRTVVAAPGCPSSAGFASSPRTPPAAGAATTDGRATPPGPLSATPPPSRRALGWPPRPRPRGS